MRARGHLEPQGPRHVFTGRRNGGTRGSQERAGGAPSARPHPTPPRSRPDPHRRREDLDTPANPKCNPNPASIRGTTSSRAAPTSWQLRPPTAPERAARRTGLGPRIPGRPPGARRVPRNCVSLRPGADREGRWGAGRVRTLTEVHSLVALGTLGRHGRRCARLLSSSARARLRVAAASSAPPAGLSARSLALRPGRGVGIPPAGSHSLERGRRQGGGAPARRAGGSGTCLAPLGPTR